MKSFFETVGGLDWVPFAREFPILFGGNSPRSLDAGPGWHNLLWELCQNLETLAQQRVATGQEPMRIMEVKPKWAELRCYLHDDCPEARALTLAALVRSRTICEVCGAEGNTCERGRWYLTLCPAHELILGATARFALPGENSGS
jgi:hypothetical protein